MVSFQRISSVLEQGLGCYFTATRADKAKTVFTCFLPVSYQKVNTLKLVKGKQILKTYLISVLKCLWNDIGKVNTLESLSFSYKSAELIYKNFIIIPLLAL